jgi:hypothetical protein
VNQRLAELLGLDLTDPETLELITAERQASDRARRIEAGFALARHLGTSEGREQVAAAGHRDGQPIAVVLDGDSDEYVAGRVGRYDGDVIVVRYEPEGKTLRIGHGDSIADATARAVENNRGLSQRLAEL